MSLLRLIRDLFRPVTDSELEERGFQYAKGQLEKGVSADELESQVSVFDKTVTAAALKRAAKKRRNMRARSKK